MLMERLQGRMRPVPRRLKPVSTRVYYAGDAPASAFAKWSSRIAIFAAVVLVVTALLHRLLSLPTSVAITIAAGVFIAAALAFAMAAIAGLDIWVTGRHGAARVIVAMAVSSGLLAIPAGVYWLSRSTPAIYDVSTDTDEPPEFTEAKAARETAGRGVNSVVYPGEGSANLQHTYYPDLKSVIVPRPPEQAYEIVLQALAKQRHKTTFEAPPDQDAGTPGFIEYTDRTMILGLTDDIVVRVLQEGEGSRIDIRSASRFGVNDFGDNAERIRLLLKEIVGRLEASVPEPAIAKGAEDGQKVKGKKDRGRPSAADRRRPDPSRSSARREPAKRASPRE